MRPHKFLVTIAWKDIIGKIHASANQVKIFDEIDRDVAMDKAKEIAEEHVKVLKECREIIEVNIYYWSSFKLQMRLSNL